jgi:hypothetical protein
MADIKQQERIIGLEAELAEAIEMYESATDAAATFCIERDEARAEVVIQAKTIYDRNDQLNGARAECEQLREAMTNAQVALALTLKTVGGGVVIQLQTLRELPYGATVTATRESDGSVMYALANPGAEVK